MKIEIKHFQNGDRDIDITLNKMNMDKTLGIVSLKVCQTFLFVTRAFIILFLLKPSEKSNQ